MVLTVLNVQESHVTEGDKVNKTINANAITNTSRSEHYSDEITILEINDANIAQTKPE